MACLSWCVFCALWICKSCTCNPFAHFLCATFFEQTTSIFAMHCVQFWAQMTRSNLFFPCKIPTKRIFNVIHGIFSSFWYGCSCCFSTRVKRKQYFSTISCKFFIKIALNLISTRLLDMKYNYGLGMLTAEFEPSCGDNSDLRWHIASIFTCKTFGFDKFWLEAIFVSRI